MKLGTGRRRRDSGDIDVLLDACGINSTAEAIDVFDRYYPNEVIAGPAMRQLRHRFERNDRGAPRAD